MPATQVLAQRLERVVASARRPGRPVLSAAIPVDRDAVLIAEPALLAIARRLRAGDPVAPAAMRHLRALVTDAASPLYSPHASGDLRAWATKLLDELDDGNR